jgi:hypothetical protein
MCCGKLSDAPFHAAGRASYAETMAIIGCPMRELPKSRVQQAAEEMMAREGFLGVPVSTFEHAGRSQLIELLKHGLRQESKILDFGCGCLRIAYWLVGFLDADGYCGIEPARKRVELGLRYLFTPEALSCKRPRFDYNADFDSSKFGTRFDFFLARSVWPHASKRQIEATLDSFVRHSHTGATFLTSYLPAVSADDDYQDDRWVGTSHECDIPGVVRHRLSWILERCSQRSLVVDELPGYDCDSQLWLRITHRTS